LHLVVGPHVSSFLVFSVALVLITELTAQQATGVVRDTTEPLLHRLLLFLLLSEFGELGFRKLLGLFALLGLFGCALQFFLQCLQVFLAHFFFAALR
jgi:hypothetical protein